MSITVIKDLIMEFGKKKMKILFLLVFIFFKIGFFAQESFNCESIDFIKTKELFTAIDKKINYFKIKNVIILVDYKREDSIDIFRINGSMDPFELFFKKPDCFCHYRDNLVYLYTENYANQKDTVWLNSVLLETVYFFDILDITINWSNDSILSLIGLPTIRFNYDPIPIEFKVYNGDVIDQNYPKNMLYPKTGKHNGIKIIEEIINERRKKILEQNNHKYSDN